MREKKKLCSKYVTSYELIRMACGKLLGLVGLISLMLMLSHLVFKRENPAYISFFDKL